MCPLIYRLRLQTDLHESASERPQFVFFVSVDFHLFDHYDIFTVLSCLLIGDEWDYIMSEVQGTVEFSVELHKFHNVDLFQRG